MSLDHHLKEHNLRVTEVRKRIYQYLLETKYAVSHAELELVFSNEFDRVTIYRTLNTFLDKGLLHKIPTDSGSARYAVCKEHCSTDEHIDDHVHFKCSKCSKLICLHEVEIPMVQLPTNFEAKNAILLYEGICNNCN